ncbi:MAG TPA: AarF/ABC1/UbiB kinase family protein [Rhodothermales bacterium]|nr:AarF/ABC1/UbiB kinase family protein [Rhodothermales bacterium]
MLTRTFQNIRRIREILQVLFKYGFEGVISETALKSLVSERRRALWTRQERPVMEYSRWERIRMVAEELGPTYVKFAQVLSNRADLLPDELITEFEKLQSHVPPFPTAEARRIIEAELGKPIAQVFEYFEDIPIGSASIGQVHLARLTDGAEVVVKVQRPNVERLIHTDLEILKFLTEKTVDFLERIGITNVMDLVTAFERTMQKELDYNNEARNYEQFRTYYKNETTFYVPKAYRDLTTRRVMVLERVRGCKITDVGKLNDWGIHPEKIAEEGMRIYLRQIFEHGYFHADPHPGNILVRPDGVICLIDFGMVGSLMDADKQNFAGIFISMARKDPRATAFYLRRLAVDDEIKDVRQLEYDLNEIIEDYASLQVSESNMAALATQLQKIMYENRMRVPGSIFLILRALAMLEGIGKVIAPNFQTMEFIKPFGVRLVADSFMPNKIVPELWNDGLEFWMLFKSLPIEGREIMRQLRKGRLKVQIEHYGFDPILEKMHRGANHLTLALITSALLLSSSLALLAPLAHTFFGMPTISFIGYMLSILMSLRLWWVSRK